MRRWMMGVSAIAVLVVSTLAAQNWPGPAPAVPTIHIGVTGVEVDTVVTDGNGRHVPDLQADDFELLQDGKPVKIASFRYVPIRPRSPNAVVPRDTDSALTPAVPLPASAQLRDGHVGRTMAIVIDDLNVTFANMARVRTALETFVDRDVRPDDAVAIVLTSGGVGRLQQFTNDKAMLHEAIRGLRTNLLLLGAGLGEYSETRTESPGSAADQLERFQAGALGAVQNVVRGMREMPGRKSVIFVSDGFALVENDHGGQLLTTRPLVMESLRRLTDESNRSFVVIHTLDSRGLPTPTGNLFAPEQRAAPTPDQISTSAQSYIHTEDGPDTLARSAGGLSFRSNDMSGAFGTALADQEGYYVLGYTPDVSTFKHVRDNVADFHEIKVKVKKSGLQARSRSGFFGLTDDELRTSAATPQDQLWTAVASPFVADELGVRVTPIFGHRKSGDLLRVLVHVDGHGLTFTKGDDGQYHAPIELLAALVDNRGAAVESKIVNVTLRSPTDPAALKGATGFNCSVELPAKEPGAYQLRVGARDTASKRTGTGYQFVRIPQLSKSRLTLSGIVLASSSDDNSAAVRRFAPESQLRYAVDAYDARLDPTSHQPALTVRTRVYRDGALVTEDQPVPVTAHPTPEDPERSAKVDGTLHLSPTLKPGDYLLQLEVVDTRAPKKSSVAQQWIDFTVAGTQ